MKFTAALAAQAANFISGFFTPAETSFAALLGEAHKANARLEDQIARNAKWVKQFHARQRKKKRWPIKKADQPKCRKGATA